MVLIPNVLNEDMLNEEIVSQLIIICQLYLAVWNTRADVRNNNTIVVLSLLIMQLARSLTLTIANSQTTPKRPFAANIISKGLHKKKGFRSKPIMQIMVSLHLNVSKMIVKHRSKQLISVELEPNIKMELQNAI